MKKHLFPVFLSLFVQPVISFAQGNAANSHRDEIMQIKGKWTKLPNITNNLDPSFPKSQYPHAYKRMDSLTAMLKYAYPQPIGIEAEYYGSAGDRPFASKTPGAWSHSSLYRTYYYNENVKKTIAGDETSTWVHFYVNYFGWFFDSNIGRYIIDRKEVSVFALHQRDGIWNGLQAYKKRSYRGERTVLITRDGEPLLIPVTQKQFLVNLRMQLEEKQKKSLVSDADYEKMRLKEIEKAKNGSYANAEAKEKAIASAQFYYDEYIKRRNRQLPYQEQEYNKNLKLIDDYITSHSEKELSQPVITPSIGSFNGSFERQAKNGYLYELVRINFSYFKNDLPKYVPQFIVMYWTWESDNKHDGPSKEFKKQLEENFPIDRLKRMMDK